MLADRLGRRSLHRPGKTQEHSQEWLCHRGEKQVPHFADSVRNDKFWCFRPEDAIFYRGGTQEPQGCRRYQELHGIHLWLWWITGWLILRMLRGWLRFAPRIGAMRNIGACAFLGICAGKFTRAIHLKNG